MNKKLSVCMATYNEAKNIKRTLAAIINWVDEVVIVDGKSTDKTVAIAKTFGNKVKIYSYDNPQMFHVNKQRALEKATGDWLLFLDADEVVSLDLKKEILSVTATNNYSGYWLPRLNHFLGKPLRKGGQYPDYIIRLFPNKTAYFPCQSVHEQVAFKKPLKLSYLTNHLLHYPYLNFESYLRKWIQYSHHEADLLLAKKVKPGFGLMLKYCFLYPFWWFIKSYFRHKGFMDGFAGFVFAFFSALRYFAIYIKLYEKS